MIFTLRLTVCSTGALLLFAPLAGAQNVPPAPAGPQSSGTVSACPTNLTAPTLSAPISAAQELYRTGNYDEALRAYAVIAAAGGTEDAAAYAGMARTYLSKKIVPDALDAANKAVALTPGKAPAIVALGEVYFRMGEIAEAQKFFLAPIRECTPDARAHLGVARIDIATSNYLLAKQEVEWAHRLDGDDPDIQELWASLQPKEERIQFLRDRLVHPANDDKETREAMQESLSILTDELDKPDHSCNAASQTKSASTNLSPMRAEEDYIYGYTLDVKLNGVSAHLQLDTGATGILINPKTAAKAGIKAIIHTAVGSIGDKGMVGSFVGNADSIKIGNLEFQKCYVVVTEKKVLHDSDGLIGGDVFSHFLVDIDLPDAKLKLAPLPPLPDQKENQGSLQSHADSAQNLHNRYIAPEMKDYTMILRFDHNLLVPTRVNNSPVKLFLLDTGSFDNLISRDVAKASTRVAGDYDTELQGISGKVNKVYRAESVTLVFAHLNQKHDDMIAFDMTPTSDSMGTEVSGILGFSTLRLLDIKIDYRDGLVDLQYDPHRVH
jgi:tetratricopeptide (TPR) repeat protein